MTPPDVHAINMEYINEASELLADLAKHDSATFSRNVEKAP